MEILSIQVDDLVVPQDPEGYGDRPAVQQDSDDAAFVAPPLGFGVACRDELRIDECRDLVRAEDGDQIGRRNVAERALVLTPDPVAVGRSSEVHAATAKPAASATIRQVGIRRVGRGASLTSEELDSSGFGFPRDRNARGTKRAIPAA